MNWLIILHDELAICSKDEKLFFKRLFTRILHARNNKNNHAKYMCMYRMSFTSYITMFYH